MSLLAALAATAPGTPIEPEPDPLSPWGTPYVSTVDLAAGASILTALTAMDTANASAADPDLARKLRLAPGTYASEKVSTAAAYVSIVGTGDTPADTYWTWPNGPSDPERQYPLNVSRTLHLVNLTIEGEHYSYAVHADGNAGGAGFPTQLICEGVHFKNATGQQAIGIGSGGRQEMYFKDCTFEVSGGNGAPFFGHNSATQSYPSLVVLDNCTILSENEGIAWTDVNSDQPDLFIVSGGSMVAPGTDVVLSLGALVPTATDSTIDYRIDSAFTVGGGDAASVSRVIPDPLPHWTDSTSLHNVHFGIHA